MDASVSPSRSVSIWSGSRSATLSAVSLSPSVRSTRTSSSFSILTPALHLGWNWSGVCWALRAPATARSAGPTAPAHQRRPDRGDDPAEHQLTDADPGPAAAEPGDRRDQQDDGHPQHQQRDEAGATGL